jgi:hypothetical protein
MTNHPHQIEIDPATQIEQLRKQRRKVDFDTFDIALQQLFTMLTDDAINVAPAYQRKYRWNAERSSRLIESVLLGIPVPSLFVATNRDGTWELVDGVQRISALVQFAGGEALRKKLGIDHALELIGLDKLEAFNSCVIEQLPQSIRLQLMLRPIKFVTLSDKSNKVVRFDLFERLNTGGVALSDQEIRDCVYRGTFTRTLETLSKNKHFRQVVLLTHKQNRDGTREECVLRFFAFLHNYKEFVHSVRGFLNDYTNQANKSFDFKENKKLFRETFRQLATVFPDGLIRPSERKLGTTSLILFEGVAVGAALAIQECGAIDGSKVDEWLSSNELDHYTKGATNDTAAVKGRIEYCRDRFLGK